MKLRALYTELKFGMDIDCFYGRLYEGRTVRLLPVGSYADRGLHSDGQFLYMRNPELFLQWAEESKVFLREELDELAPIAVLYLAGG